MTKEKYELIPQQWDTDYFGVSSAKVNLNAALDASEQEKIIKFCDGYDFVTIFNAENENQNNLWLGKKTNAFLSDINIQFCKVLKHNEVTDTKYENDTVTRKPVRIDKIIDIARETFIYSRFFNDSNLPINKSKNIYAHWTETAFNDEKKYFVVSEKNADVAGYLLFSFRFDTCVIELIAVDKKYRGKKIGESLIQNLETYLYDKGINKIKVGTQINNITAMRFYNRMGYEYLSCGSVYHLWKD